MTSILTAYDFTILNGANVSNVIDISESLPSFLLMPATFAGGYLEFDISYDNVTFYGLYDNAGNAIRYNALSTKAISMSRPDFCNVSYIRLRSVDSGGTPTNQTGDTVIQLMTGE